MSAQVRIDDTQTGNALKPMGTGLSIRACVNVQTRTRLSEFEHFCPVPICFGVIRALKHRSLKVSVVFKHALSSCPSCSGTLYQAVRLTQARSIKLFVTGVLAQRLRRAHRKK